MKAVLRGKYIALNAYLLKEKRCKIENLDFYLRSEEEQFKAKVIKEKIK